MSASTPITVSSSSSSTRVIAPPPHPPSPQKHDFYHDYEDRKPSQSQHQHTPPHPHSRSHSHSHSHSQSPTTTAQPSRPSYAIQQGADALMDLLESEKLRLTKLYHEAIRHIESSVNNAHAMEGVKLRSAEKRVKSQEKSIESLNIKLQVVEARAGSTERELKRLRREHEELKEELARVGMVWTPATPSGDEDPEGFGSASENETGTLEFTNQTNRIVSDFMRGARMQQKALMSSRLSSKMPSLGLEDDRLSKPVCPTEFFDVLSGVMERGRKFAGELEKQRRRERAQAHAAADNGNTDKDSSASQSAVEVNGHDPTVPENTKSPDTDPSATPQRPTAQLSSKRRAPSPSTPTPLPKLQKLS